MSNLNLFDQEPEIPQEEPVLEKRELRPYQQKVLADTFDMLSKPDISSVLNIMATGLGKCLGRGTPVLMFDGTVKRVEDVVEGDLLMGPDSLPRTVLSTTAGYGPLYEVRPTKGMGYIVNDAHILSLKATCNHSRKYRKGEIRNICVQDYLQESKTFHHMMKGWRTGVDWGGKHILVDPYFLGLWLGDGHSYSQSITNVDPEIIEFLKEYSAERGLNCVISHDRRSDVPNISCSNKKAKQRNPVRYALERYELLQNKHIPLDYKANSRQVRLQLLAGLIDSDGSLSGGCFDFISKSGRLAEDVCFLARSLGLAAYIKQCYKSCNGNKFLNWRVCISGDLSIVPTRIARKQAAKRQQKKDVLLTGIQVLPHGEGDYFGFTLDGDRLFMLGDFTVTHNTVIMSGISEKLDSWGHGNLILDHRDTLIEQVIKSLASSNVLGLKEKASDTAIGQFELISNTVVATPQTLQGNRLEMWPKDAFKVIQVDEAHHFVKGSLYENITNHFDMAKVIGWTATPDRLDGKSLARVFDAVGACYRLPEAVADGWLVPVAAFPVATNPAVDLRKLTVAKGHDFSDNNLEEFIQNNIGVLVNAIVDNNALEDRRTIAFTPQVGSAKSLALALKDVGVTADWVSGDRPDRDEVIKAHKRGEFQVLCNCMLLTEGYDDPAVSCILMCRPTKSRALYSQMVGRGTRCWPGPREKNMKPNCRVVDFAFITGDHDLAGPADLYDGPNVPDEVIEKAKAKLKENTETTVEEAIQQATFEFEEEERVRIIRRSVKSHASSFDLVGVSQLLGIREKTSMADWFNCRPASDKQVAALKKWGVEVTGEVPFLMAQKVLQANAIRSKYNLSTMKQINYMIRLGCEPKSARRMTRAQATAYIETHKGRRAA